MQISYIIVHIRKNNNMIFSLTQYFHHTKTKTFIPDMITMITKVKLTLQISYYLLILIFIYITFFSIKTHDLLFFFFILQPN